MNVLKKLLLLSGLIAVTGIQAELLIVKQVTEERYVEEPSKLYGYFGQAFPSVFAALQKEMVTKIIPLSDEDITAHGKAISKVLLKYQWPMCIASDLTDQEKDELLTPDVPCAEERFIEKKIRSLGPDFDNYRVVFIPTTLIECYYLYLRITNNPLFNKVLKEHNEAGEESIIRSGKSFNDIQHTMHQKYYNKNKTSYMNGNILRLGNLFMKIFNIFDERVFSNIDDLHHYIKDTIEDLLEKYFKTIDKRYYYFDKKLLLKAINADYIARRKNKGQLFRGTNVLSLTGKKILDLSSQDAFLLSSEIRIYQPAKSFSTQENISNTSSVCFGGTLFSGLFGHACPNEYIMMSNIGLCLLIDKKRYKEDQINDLFHITSLSTHIGLGRSGCFMHPRMKAACKDRKKYFSRYSPRGDGYFPKDIYGVIIAERCPLLHAALLSEYAEDNIIIIRNTTKVRDKTLIDNQKKVTSTYKKLWLITRMSDFLGSVSGMKTPKAKL